MIDLSNSKILVVDDEPTNIFVLDGLLSANNFNVITASNGKKALELIKTEKPDLVLLDIMMPEMSGIEVLQRIINDPETNELPVLMVSAKTDSEVIETAMNIGAIDYIPKPFVDIELLARVRSGLRLKKNIDHLKELIESKSNFIRTVSHDLRTPFASISGFADILLNDPDLRKKMTSEHKEFLQYIIETSHYLIGYFNKLLNWSKLEASRIELKLSQVKLTKLLDTTQMIYQKDFELKKLSFVREIKGDIVLNADETYLNQVINNLVSNAIKYTPENGIIKIKGYCLEKNNVIEISDTGSGITGISPNDLFNKPYHTSTSGINDEKGTGLGLFICKKIIDALGFEISFTSEPGKGTTFIIKC